jgi:hypothetical protein
MKKKRKTKKLKGDGGVEGSGGREDELDVELKLLKYSSRQ